MDGDGDLDVFVANSFYQDNRVWLNHDPPQVTNVLVSGTAWSTAFLDQLEAAGAGGTRGHAIPVGYSAQLGTINWVNADQAIIRFTTLVDIEQSDLVLSGVFGPDGVEDASDDYSFSDFATETGSTGEFQAVWTLVAPLEIDKLLIKLDGTTAAAVTDLAGNMLDGEWTDESSTYASGDGTPGGDFNFEFHSLPGDLDHSGTVDAVDEAQVDATFISIASPAFGGYSVFNDLNGDGLVVSNDVLFTRARSGDTLPVPSPLVQAFVAAAASGPPASSPSRQATNDQTSTAADAGSLLSIDLMATVQPLVGRDGRFGHLGGGQFAGVQRPARPFGRLGRADPAKPGDTGAGPIPIARQLLARRIPGRFMTVIGGGGAPDVESVLEVRDVSRSSASRRFFDEWLSARSGA
jgi:hypothetical protein